MSLSFLRSPPNAAPAEALGHTVVGLNQRGVGFRALTGAPIDTTTVTDFMFGASYDGDLISVNAIGPEGLVAEKPTQVMPTGPNAHAILPDPSNRYVFATNLGNDQVMQLVFNEQTGALASNNPANVRFRPGAGPRRLIFSPNGSFVYVLSEMAGTISCYAFDAGAGLLSEVETIPGVARALNGATAKDDDGKRIWAADIHMTPDGRFLYASERASSAIASFAVDGGTGRLTYLKSVATEKQPRGFQIDPHGKFLVAAGEKSDRLSVYRIDQANGDLQLIERRPAGQGANWVLFAEFN
jgi:6-phosphogluconolactonase